MSLGTQIKAARTALGLTQEALAEALGVVPQTISKWERDESQPDAALLPALADALETSLDTLFERQKGAHGDAEEALKRWLLPLPERERMEEMRKLWKSCVLVLFGRWDGPEAEQHDPFDLPGYPFKENAASLLTPDGLVYYSDWPALPYFCVLEGTAESWAGTLADPDAQRELWEALGDAETRRAILRCCKLTPGEGCDRAEMAALLGLEHPEETLPRLEKLHLLSVIPCVIDGEQTELLHVSPYHKPLAVMLLASQLLAHKATGELNSIDASRIGKPLLASTGQRDGAADCHRPSGPSQ